MGNSKRLFTMRDWEKLQEDRLLPVIQKMKLEADIRDLTNMGVPPVSDAMGGMMPGTGEPFPNSVEGSSEVL